MMAAEATGPLIIPANNSMQRTALRAAADAERSAGWSRWAKSINKEGGKK